MELQEKAFQLIENEINNKLATIENKSDDFLEGVQFGAELVLETIVKVANQFTDEELEIMEKYCKQIKEAKAQ